MLARILYAAVALCVLGTHPGRDVARAPPSGGAAGPVAAAAAVPSGGAPSGGAGTPADFAIPPKHR
jgi:hypothetical protein